MNLALRRTLPPGLMTHRALRAAERTFRHRWSLCQPSPSLPSVCSVVHIDTTCHQRCSWALMNPEAGAHGRRAGGLMTPRFKGKPNFDFSQPCPLCGYKISRVRLCAFNHFRCHINPDRAAGRTHQFSICVEFFPLLFLWNANCLQLGQQSRNSSVRNPIALPMISLVLNSGSGGDRGPVSTKSTLFTTPPTFLWKGKSSRAVKLSVRRGQH
jgi:hypothetical protein